MGQEVIVQLELTIETLAFVIVQVVFKNLVGVDNAVRRVVVTRRVEDILQIHALCYRDIAWSLHDSVVHRVLFLTSGHEVILLISVVHRRAEGHSARLVATTCGEGVLVVAVL